MMLEGDFRRSLNNSIFHKNMFFGLAYLHSVLDGRASFGTLGWNVPREFDANDFHISNRQLVQTVRVIIDDTTQKMRTLKYLFSQINFASKIACFEDRRKLLAHIGDLFNQKITFDPMTECDVSQSHYGIPKLDG